MSQDEPMSPMHVTLKAGVNSMKNRKCIFLATCSLVIRRARAKLVGFFAIFGLNFELEFDK